MRRHSGSPSNNRGKSLSILNCQMNPSWQHETEPDRIEALMNNADLSRYRYHVVHHMAAMDVQVGPPNSLASISACLDNGADVIEVDLTALADEDFLLVHEPQLEHETNGVGAVAACPARKARTLQLRHGGRDTRHPAALLSEVVARVRAHPATTDLQLDLKSVDPGQDDEVMERLARLVAPLGRRVIVSSGADWHLRTLRRIAPELRLGFDPMWLIDWAPEGALRDPRVFPRKRGAFGYFDDHLLASERWSSTARYLRQRCESLMGLVPGVETFYMHHELVVHSLNDGFNWATALRADGIKLDVWTVDVTDPRARANAVRLRDLGIALWTSNTPEALRFLLETRG